MSNELTTVELYVVPIAILVVFTYAAFWAFNIRRALAVRIYRNQALGIGLVTLSYSLTFVILSLAAIEYHTVNPIGVPFAFLFVELAFVTAFYWIDASVLAARRSDPLLRDILDWRFGRKIVWILNLVGVIITPFATGLIQFTGVGLGPIPSYVGLLGFVPILSTLFYGVVLLPIAAFRSKDSTLRHHLGWFGLFMLIQLVYAATASLTGNGLTNILFIFGGYCLYRSARSLVPLNRLSLSNSSGSANSRSLKWFRQFFPRRFGSLQIVYALILVITRIFHQGCMASTQAKGNEETTSATELGVSRNIFADCKQSLQFVAGSMK